MNYTKGKWKVKGCSIEGEDGWPIASTYPDTRLPSSESACLTQANAHLIAAAPEMYETLKYAFNILTGYMGLLDWAIKIQMAITKAEEREE